MDGRKIINYIISGGKGALSTVALVVMIVGFVSVLNMAQQDTDTAAANETIRNSKQRLSNLVSSWFLAKSIGGIATLIGILYLIRKEVPKRKI